MTVRIENAMRIGTLTRREMIALNRAGAIGMSDYRPDPPAQAAMS